MASKTDVLGLDMVWLAKWGYKATENFVIVWFF